jgi:phosphoadenosine phosphosulfate reductase
MVLTDIICGHVPEIEMFTLDTGRLHDETLALLDRVERRYQRRIQVFYPDAKLVEQYVRDNGINGFLPRRRERLSCCNIPQDRAVQARGRRPSCLGHRRASRTVARACARRTRVVG